MIFKLATHIPILNFVWDVRIDSAEGVFATTDEWAYAILNRIVGADWQEKATEDDSLFDDFWDASLEVKIMVCMNLSPFLGLPPTPVFCETCGGGWIQAEWSTFCPDITGFSMSGGVFWYFVVGFELGSWKFIGFEIAFDISCGVAETMVKDKCDWKSIYHLHKNSKYRRRWWRRRRGGIRKCNYKLGCDIYLTARGMIGLLGFQVRLSLTYWTKNKIFVIKIWIGFNILFKEFEIYSSTLYRKQM